jgi:hypothetical protein
MEFGRRGLIFSFEGNSRLASSPTIRWDALALKFASRGEVKLRRSKSVDYFRLAAVIQFWRTDDRCRHYRSSDFSWAEWPLHCPNRPFSRALA